MPQPPTTIADEFGIAFRNLADAATGAFTPTLRVGVNVSEAASAMLRSAMPISSAMVVGGCGISPSFACET